MVKIILGIISFLSSVICAIAIITKLVEYNPSRYKTPDGNLLFYLVLVLLLIYYLIITKFWKKASYTSEETKLNRECRVLKKQVEISKLKKELDELGKFSNTE